MKRQLCLLTFLCFLINVSGFTQGIKWTNGLLWKEVQAKAKAENKYIFLDCYTTWCGPCKMMDQSVFVNDSVGNYFNDKFISVKVQMDKTKKDTKDIQAWYTDATEIGKRFAVDGFPTFLYFSSDGVLTEKKFGAILDLKEFIGQASLAMTPGKVYKDPDAKYRYYVSEYNLGREFPKDSLFLLLFYAGKIKDDELGKKVAKEYIDYISQLPNEKKYTERSISYLTVPTYKNLLVSYPELAQLFYKDSKIIDRVKKQSGYTYNLLDKNFIMETISRPFLQKNNSVPGRQMSGGYSMDAEPFYGELEWKELRKLIEKKFNSKLAERAVSTARIEWYKRNKNEKALAKCIIERFEKYPVMDMGDGYDINNSLATYVFKNVSNKDSINAVLPTVKKLVDFFPPGDRGFGPAAIDTYANLLYKAGRITEAITWQEKAVAKSGDEEIIGNLVKMKRGEPTW